MRQRGRVLIVDDDADLRLTISLRLEGSGYDVDDCADGRAALARIKEETFDAIILDIRMPGMDGFEFLGRLREIQNPPDVIVLSAQGTVDSRIQGLNKGAGDYMTKPFSADELVARIEAIMRRREELTEVRREAYRDALTGLGNRRAFDKALRKEFVRARRYEHPLGLVLIDADGLKRINDNLGHEAGDRYIEAIARAVKIVSRNTDSACRIGGDEFAIILPETNRAQSATVRERFEATLRNRRFEIDGVLVEPMASIGVAVFPDDAGKQPELFQRADEALYRDKATRRRASDEESSKKLIGTSK